MCARSDSSSPNARSQQVGPRQGRRPRRGRPERAIGPPRVRADRHPAHQRQDGLGRRVGPRRRRRAHPAAVAAHEPRGGEGAVPRLGVRQLVRLVQGRRQLGVGLRGRGQERCARCFSSPSLGRSSSRSDPDLPPPSSLPPSPAQATRSRRPSRATTTRCSTWASSRRARSASPTTRTLARALCVVAWPAGSCAA